MDTSTGKNKTIVLGLGNLLMGDEGFGVHVVQKLREDYEWDGDVEIMDGGTKGIHLLGYLKGVNRLLIVDAVDGGLAPGEVMILNEEEIPSYSKRKVSPHQMEVGDLLAVAAMSDLSFEEVILVGIQPASMELSTELSPAVAAHVDDVVEKILARLREWGQKVGTKNARHPLHSKPPE